MSDNWSESSAIDDSRPSPEPYTGDGSGLSLVMTPAPPMCRMEEWVVDSSTLLADAFSVRRLLRLYWVMWKKYVYRCNCVLEALFVTERESETQLMVCVFLGLSRCVFRSRMEESKLLYIRSMCDFGLLKVYFYNFFKIKFKIAKFKQFQFKRKIQYTRKVLQCYYNQTVPIRSPRLFIEHKYRIGLLNVSLKKLIKARTLRHLDYIQSVCHIDVSRIISALKALSENVVYNGKKRSAISFLNRQLVLKSLHALKSRTKLWVKPQSVLGTYVLYKLTRNLPNIDVHVPKHYRGLSECISPAILHAAVSKWRLHTASERANRYVANKEQIRACWSAWRKWIEQTHRLRKCVFQRVDGRILFWKKWRSRIENRQVFKSNLSSHVNKRLGYVGGLVIAGWRAFVCESGRLCFAKNCVENRISRKFFCVFSTAFSQSRSEWAKRELAILHFQKTCGLKTFRGLNLAIVRRVFLSELNNRGKFLKLKIWCNRWKDLKIFLQKKLEKWSDFALKIHTKRLRNVFKKWNSLRIVRVQEALVRFDLMAKSFDILFANKTAKKRKERTHKNTIMLQKRFALKRIGEWASGRICVSKFASRTQQRLVLNYWRRKVAFGNLFQSLENLARRFVLDDAIVCLYSFGKTQRRCEITKAELLVVKRVSSILREWRLLMVFTRISNSRIDRASRSVCVPDAYFRKWSRQCVILQNIRHKCVLQIAHLKQKAYSGWIKSCLGRKLTNRVRHSNILRSFNLIRRVFVSCLEADLQLVGKISQIELWRLALVFEEWKSLHESRYCCKSIFFKNWSSHTNLQVYERRIFVDIFARKIRLDQTRCFGIWKNRCSNRTMLKQGLMNMTVTYSRRLIVGVFVGFSLNAEEARKIRIFDKRKTNCQKWLDRWITATVTFVALRDVLNRVSVVVAQSQKRLFIFELKKSRKIEAFLRQKTHLPDNNCEIIGDVLAGWREYTLAKTNIRLKLALVWKADFFDKLKIHFVEKKTKKILENRADQFYIQQQAEVLAVRVCACLDGWKRLTDYETGLYEKGQIVQSRQNQSLISNHFNLWTTLLDICLYKQAVYRLEYQLVLKNEFKIVSKFLNNWILAYIHRQKMVALAKTYRSDRVVRSAVCGWSKLVTFRRKGEFITKIRLKKYFKKLKHLKTKQVRFNLFVDEFMRKMYINRAFDSFKKLLVRKKNLDYVIVSILGKLETNRMEGLKLEVFTQWRLASEKPPRVPYQSMRQVIKSEQNTPAGSPR